MGLFGGGGTPDIEKMKAKCDLKGLGKALSHSDVEIRREAARALHALLFQAKTVKFGQLYHWDVEGNTKKCHQKYDMLVFKLAWSALVNDSDTQVRDSCTSILAYAHHGVNVKGMSPDFGTFSNQVLRMIADPATDARLRDSLKQMMVWGFGLEVK